MIALKTLKCTQKMCETTHVLFVCELGVLSDDDERSARDVDKRRRPGTRMRLAVTFYFVYIFELVRISTRERDYFANRVSRGRQYHKRHSPRQNSSSRSVSVCAQLSRMLRLPCCKQHVEKVIVDRRTGRT